MKKTSANYDKSKYILLAIILYIVIIIIDILCIKGIFKVLNTSNGELLINMRIIPLCMVSIILTISIIAGFMGTIKGLLHKLFIKDKSIKNDLYLRELPNNFGIGVTTLLFDSKIENEKDIVAIILDLCARKYLSLTKSNDKYIIKILKQIDTNLLDNEKYIMELLINNNIKNIDYYKWYNLCETDGKGLNLYYRYTSKIENNRKTDSMDDILHRIKKRSIILSVIVFIIFSLYTFFTNNIWSVVPKLSEKYSNMAIGTGMLVVLLAISISGIIVAVISYFIIYIILYLWETIKTFVTFSFRSGSNIEKSSYNNVMSNNLMRTKYGENEYQKLVSFRNFIKDFGAFADREAKEVVIWDRYLSYAQVFGLTKEIMQTGYKELIDNASFQIDNIDNINFDNIKVEY